MSQNSLRYLASACVFEETFWGVMGLNQYHCPVALQITLTDMIYDATDGCLYSLVRASESPDIDGAVLDRGPLCSPQGHEAKAGVTRTVCNRV